MKKAISTPLLIFLILFNCKAQHINDKLLCESKLLMSYVFSDFDEKASNKKLFTNTRFITNKILYNPTIKGYNSRKGLILKK
jgi:hypothetical protein